MICKTTVIHQYIRVIRHLLIIAMVMYSVHVPAPASAQETDGQLWTSAQLRREFGKSRLFAEGGYRMNENISNAMTGYGEFGLMSRIRPFLRLSITYRYMGRIRENAWHRLYTDLHLRNRFAPFQFILRTRFQSDFEKNRDMQPAIRERINIRYIPDQVPLRPYCASEIFFNPSGNEKEFEQWRLDLGMEYRFAGNHRISLFYRRQNRFNILIPGNANILGMAYVLEMFPE